MGKLNSARRRIAEPTRKIRRVFHLHQVRNREIPKNRRKKKITYYGREREGVRQGGEGGRERAREGGERRRERGRERESEGGGERERAREGGREREGEREGGREGGREME